jgi:hypothetical protein
MRLRAKHPAALTSGWLVTQVQSWSQRNGRANLQVRVYLHKYQLAELQHATVLQLGWVNVLFP